MPYDNDVTELGWRQNRKSWDPYKDRRKIEKIQASVDMEWETHITSSVQKL